MSEKPHLLIDWGVFSICSDLSEAWEIRWKETGWPIRNPIKRKNIKLDIDTLNNFAIWDTSLQR